MRKCPVCGKAFYVQFPEKWQYKRANQFICSWRCIRLLEKGEENMPKLLTDEQRDFAVQIAISGTDPRPFLISCGSNAPEKLWSYIKQTIREKDPETYKKLPATLKGLRPPEDADPVKYVKLTGPTRIETPEGNKLMDVDIPAAPKQVIEIQGPDTDIVKMEKECKFDERTTVTAIRVKDLGEFYYDHKFESIDWRTPGGDEVSLGPIWWRQLAEDLPLILKKLGAPDYE